MMSMMFDGSINDNFQSTFLSSVETNSGYVLASSLFITYWKRVVYNVQMLDSQ